MRKDIIPTHHSKIDCSMHMGGKGLGGLYFRSAPGGLVDLWLQYEPLSVFILLAPEQASVELSVCCQVHA